MTNNVWDKAESSGCTGLSYPVTQRVDIMLDMRRIENILKIGLDLFVLSCPVLSCLVLSCDVLSCLVLSCLVLSCLVLSCLCVTSCHLLCLVVVLWLSCCGCVLWLSCGCAGACAELCVVVLFCLVLWLSCLVLSCFMSSCLVLPSLVFYCLVLSGLCLSYVFLILGLPQVIWFLWMRLGWESKAGAPGSYLLQIQEEVYEWLVLFPLLSCLIALPCLFVLPCLALPCLAFLFCLALPYCLAFLSYFASLSCLSCCHLALLPCLIPLPYCLVLSYLLPCRITRTVPYCISLLRCVIASPHYCLVFLNALSCPASSMICLPLPCTALVNSSCLNLAA
jgi:hypothetical protein